jgi:glycosyltransferase involved in cell wall biosynthesis
MKKRIAFLTTQFKEVKSGPGRFTEYLKSLEFDSLEIHFFSQQIQERSLFQVPVPIPMWARKIPFSSLFRAWYFNKSVLEQDNTEPFDVILAADYSMAMFLSTSLLKKTAVMVNDDNYLLIFSDENKKGKISARKSLSRQFGYFLERYVVKKAAYSIANSLYTKGLIEKIYKLPDPKVRLLYKAVDLSFFRFNRRNANPPLNFLFVKNDWIRGGLDLIIEAMSKLENQKDLHLQIAGISDDQQPVIREMILNSGFKGKTNILGLVNREALFELLNNADVFLNFSRQEALGVSCLEAMASGLPVVGSDAGGLKEILANGKAGFMVRHEDVSGLINTFQELQNHPERMVEKSLFAREHVKKFSVEQLKENLERLFH